MINANPSAILNFPPPAILRMFEIEKKRYPEFATQDNVF